MSNLNKIIIVGKLTENPAMKNSDEGNAMAKYVLAVDRPRRADGTPGETDFIEVVSWGRQAEIAAEKLKKGKTVLIEGRVQVRSFDKDGQRKWVTEVITNNIALIEAGSNSPMKKENAVQPSTNKTEPVLVEEDIPF